MARKVLAYRKIYPTAGMIVCEPDLELWWVSSLGKHGNFGATEIKIDIVSKIESNLIVFLLGEKFPRFVLVVDRFPLFFFNTYADYEYLSLARWKSYY